MGDSSMQQQRLLVLSTLLVLGACASRSTQSPSSAHQAENPFQDAHVSGPLEWAEKQQLAHFRLLFSGNVNGQLEPCGCSVNPKGGLDRRLNFVRQQKADKSIQGKL